MQIPTRMKQALDFLAPHVEEGAKIMLLLFLTLSTLIFLGHAIMVLLHPYPLDYGEAPLVDQAMRLAAGQPIYHQDLGSPPYTISNYPPLYVLTMAPFVKLFGANFWAGRALSIISTLLSSLFIGLIIVEIQPADRQPHVRTQNRVIALTTALTFLAIPYVVEWSSLARVDMLALALSTGGLYSIVRLSRQQSSAPRAGSHIFALLIPALLLVAAAYTRQSYGLAAPFAAFVWLWVSQDKRQALLLAALVGGLGLGLFLLLNILTQGGFFFNVITANVNPFSFERVMDHWRNLQHTVPLLLIFSLAFLFFGFRQAKPWPLLAPYLIGATLSAVTIGKVGSNINYLLELSAALSMATGALIVWVASPRPPSDNTESAEAKVQQQANRPQLLTLLYSTLMIVLAVQVGLLMRSTLQGPIETAKWRTRPIGALRKLEKVAQEAETSILADEFMGMITLQNRPLYIQPFEVTQLANAGLWDQTPLLADIRDQKFSAIMIHYFMWWPVYKTRWTPEMLSAISEHYVATQFLADTIVYRPRDVAEHGPAELEACPGAPWRLPSRGDLGMWWLTKELSFMGEGYENTVPVYAVADGLLTRRADWNSAIAIQHDDPLSTDQKVWSFYGDMADRWNEESFVASDFPAGVADIPVKRGQLLGYQGRHWQGQEGGIWPHIHFAIVPALEDGAFPAALVGMESEQDERLPWEIEDQGVLDPSPYLGTIRSQIMGTPTWLPMRCQDR